MGKLTRLAMVAVLLAVAMLSSAGVASADGKAKGVERDAPQRASGITWE